jgi:hypothetical protein
MLDIDGCSETSGTGMELTERSPNWAKEGIAKYMGVGELGRVRDSVTCAEPPFMVPTYTSVGLRGLP